MERGGPKTWVAFRGMLRIEMIQGEGYRFSAHISQWGGASRARHDRANPKMSQRPLEKRGQEADAGTVKPGNVGERPHLIRFSEKESSLTTGYEKTI